MPIQPDNKQETIKVLSPDSKGQTTGIDGSEHDPLKQGSLSRKWFTALGAYKPTAGIKVEKLICGQVAFKAIHEAIENAKNAVDIVIWGFDPMMRFNPDEPNNLTIGELLEKKGQQGVKCHIMVWYDNLGKLKEPTLIGSNFAGVYDPDAIYKHNIDPNPNQLRLNEYLIQRDELKEAIQLHEQKLAKNQPIILREASQYEKNQAELTKTEKEITALEEKLAGYGKGSGGEGGPNSLPEHQRQAFDWIERVTKGKIPNVRLKTRNFAYEEATNIEATVIKNQQQTNTTWAMNKLMRFVPSHHQKIVLIDYELPESDSCTAFVMGHNMHRNYWDTTEHYYYDQDANRVQGFGPWQDISLQVWGIILYDINENFVKAWSRITPLETDEWQAKRSAIKESDFKPKGHLQAQFCRTQPQVQLEVTGDYERSILAIYKKAIENSQNYLFMENQYFRYEDIAKQIKEHAYTIKKNNKEFNVDRDALYLFVLTNAPNDKNFSSSTYAMMKELGQQQLMPKTQKELYYHEQNEAFKKANPHLTPYSRVFWTNKPGPIDEEAISQKDQDHTKDYSVEDIPKMSQDGKGWDIEGKDGKKPFELEHEAMAKYGLKVIIGTLTTDSSITNNNPHFTQGGPNTIDTYHSRYTRYRDIYIHTKLLVVDDLFTFLGSANINTRSFWADSESGIAIPDPELAFSLRNELWQLHTKQSINGSETNASKAIQCDTTKNYTHWDKTMNRNWKHKAKGEPLECHLTRFWDEGTGYAQAVD